MVILFEEKLFLQDWLYKGCTAKVLVLLVANVSKSCKNEIRLSRKELCQQLGESDWSVRVAVKTLIEHQILLQLPSSSGAASIYSISTAYMRIGNKSLQLPSSSIRKKSKNSPASLQLPSSSECKANNCNTDIYKGNDPINSPASLQLPSSSGEKETKKKNSPTPPIKKIKKKEIVLTDGSQLSPDGKVVLNKRAREVFEKTYLGLYGTTYYWTAKDAGQMTKLLNAIKFSRQNRPVPLQNDVDSVIVALEKFLLSINKTWINNNFSVSMIASHYNEIISELKNEKNNGKTMHGTGNSADSRRAEIVSNIASYDEKWKRENSLGGSDR